MSEKRARLWPAYSIIGFTITAWLIHYSIDQDLNRQKFFLVSVMIVLCSLGLLFLWSLFFSNLKWKLRFIICGVMLIIPVLLLALFKIEDNTGDLVPIFTFRWTTNEMNQQNTPTQLNELPKPGQAWSQFHGPLRNGISPDTPIDPDWKKHPPRLIWKKTVGKGYAGTSIENEFIYTAEQQDKKELIQCYSLKNGELIWSYALEERFESGLGGIGPRSTPTIVHDKLVYQGATGILVCLDKQKGTLYWKKDLKINPVQGKKKAEMPEWGYSPSPLVIDQQVFVFSDGADNSTLSINLDNGEIKWNQGNEPLSYSSPIEFNFPGKKQIINFSNSKIISHDITDGKILWDFPWREAHPHCALPIILSDHRIFFSSGYGTGCALLQISTDEKGEFTAERIWRSTHMKAKFNNPILFKDHIFGLDDGILACISLVKGKRTWKKGRYGHGQMILSGNNLIVLSEKGELALVEANPKAYRELAKVPVLEGKTWNPLALSGPYLVVRNHHQMACYLLKQVTQ